MEVKNGILRDFYHVNTQTMNCRHNSSVTASTYMSKEHFTKILIMKWQHISVILQKILFTKLFTTHKKLYFNHLRQNTDTQQYLQYCLFTIPFVTYFKTVGCTIGNKHSDAYLQKFFCA